MAENTISTRTFLLNYLKIFLLIVAVSFIVVLSFYSFAPTLYTDFEQNIGWATIFTFIAVGFAAQMIDGSLGMAYGISCSSFLMATGVTPVLASASVHVA